MGKINVVLDDGTVVAVDEADYKASRGQVGAGEAESSSGALARYADAERRKQTSGIGAGVTAITAGLLDTVTAGGFGKLVEAIDPDEGKALRELRQDRPGMNLLGSVAGLVVPTGVAGLATKAAKGVKASTGSAGLARGVEGAIHGAGGYVAGTNVSGDDLSIEGLVEGIGIGGALNVAFGAVGDKIKTGAERVGAGRAKAAASKALTPAEAAKAKQVLNDLPAYGNYKAAHEAAQIEARAHNAAILKDTTAYKKAVSPKGLDKNLVTLEKQQAELRSEIQHTTNRATQAPDLLGPDELAGLAQKQTSLRDLSAANRAAREAIASGDLENAALLLRKYFPDIPIKPGEAIAVGPKLPGKLSDLGSAHSRTVNDLAGSTSSAAKKELDALATELGLAPTETALDTLTSIHGHLNKNFKGVVASGGAATKSEGFLDKAQDWTRNVVRYSAARAADVGGWRGAVLRTVVGGSVGYALTGAEGALMGGALLHGKTGIRGKIADTVARYGPSVGKTIGRMGPVVNTLRVGFPGGQDDPEPNDGKLVLNRINDVALASYAAPDAMFEAVRDFADVPGDVAFKVAQKFVNGLKYLTEMAPKDPGIDVTAHGSDWAPSFLQADEWAHRYEAVLGPDAYIARVLAGDGHPSGVEALNAQWPAIMQETLLRAANEDWKDLSLEQSAGLSMLFGQPISGLQHPDVQAMLQSSYLPQPTTANQPNGSPRATGGANGRPPAVNSSVAGSSVSGLIK